RRANRGIGRGAGPRAARRRAARGLAPPRRGRHRARAGVLRRAAAPGEPPHAGPGHHQPLRRPDAARGVPGRARERGAARLAGGDDPRAVPRDGARRRGLGAAHGEQRQRPGAGAPRRRLPDGRRPRRERRRPVGARARPREPVGRRRARARERELLQRDAHVRRRGAAHGRGDRAGV
ncbi:MAG: hypothetical protein AVDCRST_MAG11-4117, partial [uncultured Gemmatimonadaceae bacterium]